MKELFDLFNVKEGDWRALWLAYREEDQQLMRSGRWCPDDPRVYKAISLLLQIPEDATAETFHSYILEMFWIYYHHGITWALYKEKNRMLAKWYAFKASQCVLPDNPNKVTEFLSTLLVRGVVEAEKFALTIPKEIVCTGDIQPGPNPDWERAQEILADWKAGLI